MPSLRAFLRTLLPTWHDVDEVLQETSMLLWKKFDQYQMGTNFFAWACVVARFEVMRYRRKKARDRHVFSDEVLVVLAEECLLKEEQLLHQRSLLKLCVEKVDPKQKKLLLESYSRGFFIKDLAEREGRSPTALYKMLARLRAKLITCVKGHKDWAYE